MTVTAADLLPYFSLENQRESIHCVPMDHDHSYKNLFSHPEMVSDLLRGFVREDWVAEVDFTTLERVSGSYVADDLRGLRRNYLAFSHPAFGQYPTRGYQGLPSRLNRKILDVALLRLRFCAAKQIPLGCSISATKSDPNPGANSAN